MSADPKKKRSAEEVWKAIEEEAGIDEMHRIAAMSREDIDNELRAAGFDPARVAANGKALAERLLARRDRELHPAGELERARARLAARNARRGTMSRSELMGRIDSLRRDPALPARAAVLFRNKNQEEASEEELAGLLDQLEDLIEEHVDTGKKP